MTEELGDGYAWLFGTAHKITGSLLEGNFSEVRMDLHNNKVGRESAFGNIDKGQLQSGTGNGRFGWGYEANATSSYPY